jgi:CRISPR-associated endonuclease Cas2
VQEQGWYIVAYDIADNRRRQRLHRRLRRDGLALQQSVFLVRQSHRGINRLLDELAGLIERADDDLRAYPVNALLSLGYPLLAGEVLRAVQQLGLDPALGFLHGVVPGRESLVLDLMEPLRPGVDLLVVRMLDDLLRPTQFTHGARDGCRLDKGGRNAFHRAWAVTRADWPDLAARRPGPPSAAAGAPPPAAADGAPAPAPAGRPPVSLQTLCRRQAAELARRLRRHLPAAVDGGEHG